MADIIELDALNEGARTMPADEPTEPSATIIPFRKREVAKWRFDPEKFEQSVAAAQVQTAEAITEIYRQLEAFCAAHSIDRPQDVLVTLSEFDLARDRLEAYVNQWMSRIGPDRIDGEGA